MCKHRYCLSISCLFLATSLVLLVRICTAAEAAPAEFIADDLADRIIKTSQDWGSLGINTAVQPRSAPAMKLRIQNQAFSRGLGSHANGEILVALDGDFKSFDAEIGVQWMGGKTPASIVFQVFVDDQKKFDSGVMRENDPPRHMSLDVQGARRLKLVATNAGDGIQYDCANWAEARLLRDPDPSYHQKPCNIEAFAQVVAWDPNRMEGTLAGRTQEFPAEDIFLSQRIAQSANGTYKVPIWKKSGESLPSDTGCIGLQWYESRLLREVSLELADASVHLSDKQVQVQYWEGKSAWQGNWKPLQAKLIQTSGRWTWRLGYKGRVTQKVRWLFSSAQTPLAVKTFGAKTDSYWKTTTIRLESQHPTAGVPMPIEIYNGYFLDESNANPFNQVVWDVAAPISLKVRYSAGRTYETDQTALRLKCNDLPLSVAMDDVLARDGVFIPHHGVFVTRESSPIHLKEYLAKNASRQTVLQRVRELPDQSFQRAMKTIHNPIQNRGPMMLSLACDNRKFIVHHDRIAHDYGTIDFQAYDKPDATYDGIKLSAPNGFDSTDVACAQIHPRFGKGAPEKATRHLEGGWLPIPVTTVEENGIVYRQRSFVAPVDPMAPANAPSWYRQRAVCVAEYTIKNSRTENAQVSLELSVYENAKEKRFAKLKKTERAVVALAGDRVLAFVDLREAAPLDVHFDSGVVQIRGNLAADGMARVAVLLPAWKVSEQDVAQLKPDADWARKTKIYWQDVLSLGARIDVPDRLLSNVIRASQVHCFLAARCEAKGSRVAPWIASDRYGPLESESQAVIRGMDLMGHSEFARRGLDFFIERYNPAGYLTTGYTLVGTGEHLWTLAEHYDRTRDRPWLEQVADTVVRACNWITTQRQKTQRLDIDGGKVPEYGLMPPGVSADWGRYAYRFFNDAQYCTALREAGRVLAEINHPQASAILEDAALYRNDILRAYQFTQSRTPVLPLSDGTWVPPYPTMLSCFGDPGSFYPGEDAARSWCYAVELGAHHLAATGVLDPRGREATSIIAHMEDVQFLRSGMGDYPEEKNRQDKFDLGGFSKVQPYYTRIAEIHAQRDDVKPFIRSYFNALASLLSTENLSLWEHFHNISAWNKTHETGWFLSQTRFMLVMERGDELWLAPFVTDRWMRDGMRVSVQNAPTRFGPVGFTIVSHTDKGYIEAVIDPPTRGTPSEIVIRLRHPEGKQIQSATVNGKPHNDFDPEKQYVRIQPTSKQLTVRVRYRQNE